MAVLLLQGAAGWTQMSLIKGQLGESRAGHSSAPLCPEPRLGGPLTLSRGLEVEGCVSGTSFMPWLHVHHLSLPGLLPFFGFSQLQDLGRSSGPVSPPRAASCPTPPRTQGPRRDHSLEATLHPGPSPKAGPRNPETGVLSPVVTQDVCAFVCASMGVCA